MTLFFFQKNVKNAKNEKFGEIYEHFHKKTYKSSYTFVQNMKKNAKKIFWRNEIEHNFESEQKHEIFIQLTQFLQIVEHTKKEKYRFESVMLLVGDDQNHCFR